MPANRKPKTRKERRRQERILKKARKHAFFSISKNTKVENNDSQLQKKENLNNGNQVKSVKFDMKTLQKEENNLPQKGKTINKGKTKENKSAVKKRKRELSPSEIRKKQLLEANELEDRNIKRLEKKLKLNKRKSKSIPRSFIDDGLAYILEACDQHLTEKNPDVHAESTDDEKDADFDEESVDQEVDKESVDQEVDKESVDLEVDKESEDMAERSSDIDETENESVQPAQWEDIYGRTRNADGSLVKMPSVYVPPAKQETSDSKLNVLKKRLKGLINRLSESNLQPISTQIEEMYMSHSRNNMNETMTLLLIDATCQPMLTPERLIQEHAVLVALLHANIGAEIGAHILQHLVKKFHHLHSSTTSNESKEIHNVLLLISHIYNFKVINCLLIFNIMDTLIERFKEVDIELLLLLLKSVGFHLRRDDPILLKETVLKIQSKASQATAQEQSRVRFMLEILMAIRNNNVSKIPNYDDSNAEHLKKLLRGFIRKGNTITELRISLKDFLEVEQKGRWWMVGSAWENATEDVSNKVNTTIESLALDKVNDEVLEMARRQRMNTDVRRSIFCILMTAQDYLDCFEKLLRLGLKNQQEREIVIVILDCCLHEVTFNPYYSYLAEKFCSTDRKYQMAFQFALWDHFKEIQNLTKVHLKNLSQFLSHLLLAQSLSLSVLKVLYFAEMDKPLVSFLKQTFRTILLAEAEEKVIAIFQRIQFAKKLQFLRESVRLFLQHFMKNVQKRLTTDEQEKIKNRINLVCSILSSEKD